MSPTRSRGFALARRMLASAWLSAVSLAAQPLEPIALANPAFEADPAMSAGTPSGWTWNGLGARGTSAGGTSGSLLFWQGNGSTIRQVTDHVITTAGQPYLLTLDCRSSWYGSPKAVVFYVDGTERVPLGSGFLPEDGPTWPAWKSLTIPVSATAASVGKPIGVELTQANYPGNTWSEFDKVALAKGGPGGGGGGGGDPAPNPAAIPTPPDLSQGWIATRYNQILADLAANPNRAKAAVLFVGDSITQFWNAEGAATWAASGFGDPSGPRFALNLGEAGDRTEHVLHRLQPAPAGGAGNLDLPDIAPRAIVLKIGINNTWSHANDQIVGGIQAVVARLGESEPQASILLVSILPHVEAARSRDRILPINAAVRAWVQSGEAPPQVTFVDAYPAFVDANGAQVPGYFGDGIHLTAAGYERYASVLLPWIDSALADYDAWADDQGLSGGPFDDEDGDGFANLHEYALRGDPRDAAAIPASPGFGIVDDGEARWAEFVYPRRSSLGNRATYHLQASDDTGPRGWANATPASTRVAASDADFDLVTARLPADEPTPRFFRLLVEEAPPPHVTFLFPEGRPKALVLSYDDGAGSDRKLVGILDRHGLKGTFNLNSGVLGRAITWLTTGNVPHAHVAPSEVATLYAGHEVAAHSVSHPRLPELPEAEARAEIVDDVAALQSLAGRPVRSLAYPFGAWNDAVARLAREAGITNARTTWDTGGFCPPEDRLAWNPTTHDSRALEFVDEFLALEPGKPAIFFVWGHSWEYDIDASERPWNTVAGFSWASFEEFCRLVAGKPDIWYAGAGEVAAYLDALDRVTRSGSGLTNRSAAPVWFRAGDAVVRLEPGESWRPAVQ